MSDPNYRTISPPDDKSPGEYSYVERRAELYDMIERAGHYRNLERSQRELGRRYDVSAKTVNKDIQRVNEWIADHMGGTAEAELETIKDRAIQKLISEGDEDKAFYLMKNYWETLMEAGVKDTAEDDINLNVTDASEAYAASIDQKYADNDDTDASQDE